MIGVVRLRIEGENHFMQLRFGAIVIAIWHKINVLSRGILRNFEWPTTAAFVQVGRKVGSIGSNQTFLYHVRASIGEHGQKVGCGLF